MRTDTSGCCARPARQTRTASLVVPGAPVLLRELREGNRRRVALDPASKFFDPRTLGHGPSIVDYALGRDGDRRSWSWPSGRGCREPSDVPYRSGSSLNGIARGRTAAPCRHRRNPTGSLSIVAPPAAVELRRVEDHVVVLLRTRRRDGDHRRQRPCRDDDVLRRRAPQCRVGLVTVNVHRVGGRGLESIRDDAPGRVLPSPKSPGIRAVVDRTPTPLDRAWPMRRTSRSAAARAPPVRG